MGANGNGHTPTDKTRAEVSALTSFGISQEEVSTFLDIDSKTLRKHYRRELDTGTIKANAAMAKRLFDAGVKDGDVRAMIFWLKTRARWSEAEDKKIVELSGPEGAPIKFATDPIEASKVYQDLMAGKS